jgi:hypothetical protein
MFHLFTLHLFYDHEQMVLKVNIHSDLYKGSVFFVINAFSSLVFISYKFEFICLFWMLIILLIFVSNWGIFIDSK